MKPESHTGLQRQEDEKTMTEFSFLGGCSFKGGVHISWPWINNVMVSESVCVVAMTTYIGDNHYDTRYLSLNRQSASFAIWIAFKDYDQCNSETESFSDCVRVNFKPLYKTTVQYHLPD